jgi:raffinose/stachyose/melibiose transport system substrate-binding protein
VIDNGDLPAAAPQGASVDPNSSLAAISKAWGEKSKAGTLTPYLDWATSTMGDTLFGGLQQLTEAKVTPEQFTAAVQKDWEQTHS